MQVIGKMFMSDKHTAEHRQNGNRWTKDKQKVHILHVVSTILLIQSHMLAVTHKC